MTPLERYLNRFSLLNTDCCRHRWAALTSHRVPNKPILLLSILDLITQGSIPTNFIEPSRDLVEPSNTYWQLLIGSRQSAMAKLREMFSGAKLDGNLYLLGKSVEIVHGI